MRFADVATALTITSFGFQPSFAASMLACTANFPNAKMRYAFAFEALICATCDATLAPVGS